VTNKQKIVALAKVMGWKPRVVALTSAVFDAPDGKAYDWPGNWNPLESIADAWMIVDRMKEKHDLKLQLERTRTCWKCGFTDFGSDLPSGSSFYAISQTAPLAICEAIFKAFTDPVTPLEALRNIELFLAEELAVRKGSYEPDPTPFGQALIDDAQKALDIAREAIRAAGGAE
jgi:hypothetical protein